jgi:hypothetical protein
MNLEIHNPELLLRVTAHIKAGHAHDADELLEKALDAFNEKSVPPTSVGDMRTGADLIAALQASHHRELEIEPPRVRARQVRDVFSKGLASRHQQPFRNTP